MKLLSKETMPPINPYIAGIFLGLTLLASFLILGEGLGASGGLARISAFLEGRMFPAHTQATEYFGAWGATPLKYYSVFMLIGVFIGGLFSAVLSRRIKPGVERGKASPLRLRLIFAASGGVLSGFASQLIGGSASDLALSAGAQLLSGSIVFLICVFASGYTTAWLVRRQWND
ncbi:MAG: YeeE/YedE family protein [Deltaproteobacteria bacterium]|nr:YeeE/YedE family protein [Deltaproteobacteria bacterium]